MGESMDENKLKVVNRIIIIFLLIALIGAGAGGYELIDIQNKVVQAKTQNEEYVQQLSESKELEKYDESTGNKGFCRAFKRSL